MITAVITRKARVFGDHVRNRGGWPVDELAVQTRGWVAAPGGLCRRVLLIALRGLCRPLACWRYGTKKRRLAPWGLCRPVLLIALHTTQGVRHDAEHIREKGALSVRAWVGGWVGGRAGLESNLCPRPVAYAPRRWRWDINLEI